MVMGIYECLWVSWISMGIYGLLGIDRYLWVSMGIYGCHGCIWVLYLNIKNFAYFFIQEPKKTSEITHAL